MFRIFSLLQLGLFTIGVIWMALKGYPVVAQPDPVRDLIAFFLLFYGLMGLELLFSRFFPGSFKASEALHAQIGAVLRSQGMTHHQALILALASGLGEETLFRGALQNALLGGWAGVGLQALVFAALHPVTDHRAWSYPLFVLLGGVMFGATYHLTGNLIPGILAHYLHNARGFYGLLEEKPPVSNEL
jgi:membrane protease YdiL (CAAX protease family)